MKVLVPQLIHDAEKDGQTAGSLSAATLFLDIAGFTAMTQALMRYGKEGAEVMVKIINNIFSPIIDTTYAHGGSITGFAGDAFTAVFYTKADFETPPIALLSAAIRIQQIFKEQGSQSTPFGTFTLAVKQGLDYGQVDWGIVGVDSVKSWFFRGEAIDGSAYAEHFAKQGDLILSPRFLNELNQSEWNLEEKGEGYHLLHAETTRYVPPQKLPTSPQMSQINQRFYSEPLLTGAQPNEFRYLVPIFLSFKGINSAQEIDQLTQIVMQTTHAYGGFFSDLDFGDKGGLIILYFGAPTAYEDNGRRALNCMLALREKLQTDQLPDLQWRAGVTYDIAFTGYVGSRLRAQYTCMGNVMNLAARFMAKAEWGEVLLMETLVTKETNFAYTALGPQKYKGFSDPIPTFRLEGRKRNVAAFFADPMVGREQELQNLLTFAQPVLAGQSAGLVAIYGEAGMGKSRLVYELQTTVGETVGAWFVGQADQILQASLNPFVYWLKSFFGQQPDNSIVENQQMFTAKFEQLIVDSKQITPEERRMQAELRRTKSFLGALLGLHWADSLYEQLDDPKLRHDNTILALKNLISLECMRHPVIFELEDGHWLDAGSQELLTHLSRVVGEYPLLILVTARYNDDGSKPQFDFGFPYHEIELTTLTKAALAQQMKILLGSSANEALIDFLYKRTNGNPFFTEQLLRYLQENDLLEDVDGRYQLRQDERTMLNELPSSINAILIARLDRLAQSVKTVVQTAAVFGREFDLRILMEVLDKIGVADLEFVAPTRVAAVDSDKTTAEVAIAEQEQIWQALSEIQYIFKHALLREAAYDMQLRELLRRLHHLIAETYEESFAETIEAYYQLLAYHYQQAQMGEKERHYTILAAQQAVADGELVDGANYAERALTLVEDPQKQLMLQLLREKAYNLLGQRERQGESLTAAQQLVNDSEYGATLAPFLPEILLRQAIYENALSQFQLAADTAARALAKGLEQQQPVVASQALSQWGRALLSLGAYEEAKEKYSEAATHVEGDTQDKEKISAWAESMKGLGMVAYYLGKIDLARTYWEEALNGYRQAENRMGEGSSLNNLGAAASASATYEVAKRYYEQSLLIDREIGDRLGEGRSLNNLGTAVYALGDYAAAQTFQEEALAIKREIGDRWAEALSLGNLGNIATALGDYATAQMYQEEALLIQQEVGDKRGVGRTFEKLGNLAKLMDRYELARSYYEQALAMQQEIGDRLAEATSVTHLAVIAYILGDFVQAQAYHEQSLAINEVVGDKEKVGNSLCNLAAVAFALGEDTAAHAYGERALGLQREIGDKGREAVTLYYLAQLAQRQEQAGLAEQLYRESLQAGVDHPHLQVQSQVALGLLRLGQGERAEARELMAPFLQYYQEQTSLNLLNEPYNSLLAAVQILEANDELESGVKIVISTYKRLTRIADHLSTPHARELFWANEIYAAFRRRYAKQHGP